MDELEDLHTDQTNIYFYHNGSSWRWLEIRKATLIPPTSSHDSPYNCDSSKVEDNMEKRNISWVSSESTQFAILL